ncbi:MAG TPA: phosphatidylglycerophosphatase A [Syntrophobacteria bacterium]|nr:phosphatidylglycerophosphatase A [Syntrophobacteria bacterium]
MERTRRNDLIVFLATGCFSGFLPGMPGTWGTFAAIPLIILVHRQPPWVQVVAVGLFFLIAVWVAGRGENLLGGRDPRPIVIDEMCGFLVSLLWLPLTPLTLIAGFLLFRFLDIMKPPPIRSLERRLRGGLAVVMDDVVAGIYTAILLRLVLTSFGLI